MAALLMTDIQKYIGTAADRAGLTTTGVKAGSTFYETDTFLTYIWDSSAWQLTPAPSTTFLVRKAVVFTGGAGLGAIGTVALFTVTGAVKISVIATCSETLVGAATLECGIAGTTAGIIAQIADATDLAAGEIWADATPTLALDTLANSELNFVMGNGQDIFLTVGAAAITDGTITFNIVWSPVNATGNVVAA